MSLIFVESVIRVPTANWLFSQTNTTGTHRAAARLRDSWNVPWFDAPSPRKDTATRPFFWSFDESAAPTASGIPPALIPFAPKIPISVEARCMDPPLPLL